jgi:hypothetical protein
MLSRSVDGGQGRAEHGQAANRSRGDHHWCEWPARHAACGMRRVRPAGARAGTPVPAPSGLVPIPVWGMGHATQPPGLECSQTRAMHWLQRANLKSTRAWQLETAAPRPGRRAIRPRLPRPRSLDRLGPAQSAGCLQAPGGKAEQAPRDIGAWNVRAPQQRLRGSHERLPTTGRAGCPALQKRSDLHQHRLPAHGQAHGPAHFTVRARHPARRSPCGSAGVRSSAKENDEEPLARPRFAIVANASCRLVTVHD